MEPARFFAEGWDNDTNQGSPCPDRPTVQQGDKENPRTSRYFLY